MKFFSHSVAPLIEETSPSTEVNITLSVSLVCLVSGSPLPSVTWQKDGRDVDQLLTTRITFFEFDVISINGSYESR